MNHYSEFLSEHEIILTKANGNQLLSEMGLEGKIPLDKIDLFIASKLKNSVKPLGGIHLKSSIAERRTDDVPASEQVMKQGFLSLFITLDGKDTPSPKPINKGEYGPSMVYDSTTKKWKGSDKRRDIEVDGLFSAVFSFNTRTIESPLLTTAGSRIVRIDFTNSNDKFSRYLLGAKARILKKHQKKK